MGGKQIWEREREKVKDLSLKWRDEAVSGLLAFSLVGDFGIKWEESK